MNSKEVDSFKNNRLPLKVALTEHPFQLFFFSNLKLSHPFWQKLNLLLLKHFINLVLETFAITFPVQ